MSDYWDKELERLTSSSTESDRGLKWLIIAAIATIVLWQIPFGNYILYPFTILATWFHEMGHGLMAMLLGGNFEKLLIFPNGSGIAMHSGSLFLGRLGQALVNAAGPMGPPVAGAALILLSRGRSSTRTGLLVLGAVLLISTLIWVRSLFGWVAIPLLGLSILAIALNSKPWLQAFAIQFLGVQACISTYHQVNYLFTEKAVINGQMMLSDSGQIAQALFLPYWFWGGLMAVASLIILWQSLHIAYR
ncbi:MAG: M50 family metallopeptidase [Synechococcales cyanobacterium T60_A2020_003]|nr:M50 family metallopeptidase [Synechococcales cyanobacterium T60_A2020_003]